MVSWTTVVLFSLSPVTGIGGASVDRWCGSTVVLAITATVVMFGVLTEIRLGSSTRQIAARLHLTEGTVNNYVAATLHIFDASSRAHAVAKALELGLLEPLR